MEFNFPLYYHWVDHLSTCATEAQRDTLLEINVTHINIHTYTHKYSNYVAKETRVRKQLSNTSIRST